MAPVAVRAVTSSMWDVSTSMHVVQALCGMLCPFGGLSQPQCGLSPEKTENEDMERTQGQKKVKEDRERR